ncbi:histidine triad (HIT) family protein [Kineococcus xinjiangensis]|uniref:Histidine triad (HIT) family protein n=1 Tax=Kineococcus xinjiangensis TaxID=512762 RepID=A0A2S6IIW3_9ACTN|nr:HIT domain-containing protein [Kineococcus xinjiangensis]PPK94138.1 histidine triad (HIT) family protein [Kineococcus xinjiangensis]
MSDAAREEDLFLRIIAGEIPADVVHSDDLVVAFRDIAPKADTHVLVVPRERYPDVPALAAAAPQTLAHVVAVAKRIADAECGGEFRLVFNTGASAGQTVFHVHAHVLGGKGLAFTDL